MEPPRKKRDISLREMAKEFGISVPYLSDIELGRRNVSARILKKIKIGYTLATRKLFTDISNIQNFLEVLLNRPIYTHEMGKKELWKEACDAFEHSLSSPNSKAG